MNPVTMAFTAMVLAVMLDFEVDFMMHLQEFQSLNTLLRAQDCCKRHEARQLLILWKIPFRQCLLPFFQILSQ
jgi:hypothetical protein